MSAIDPTAIPTHDGHDAAHGHGHDNPHLAHHFDTPEQQFDSAKLGMWAFLATEILMFGGLFCAYAVYRYNNPNVFRYGEHHLDTTLGTINTIVLLASSLTMALAVRAAQLAQRTQLILLLSLTLLGGVGFMCIKTVEYKTKWDHGYFPGFLNSYDRIQNPDGFQKNVVSHMGGGHSDSEVGVHDEDHVDDLHETTTTDGLLKGDVAEAVSEGGKVPGPGDPSHRPVGDPEGVTAVNRPEGEAADGVEPAAIEGSRNATQPTDVNQPSELAAAEADENMPGGQSIGNQAGILPPEDTTGETSRTVPGQVPLSKPLAHLGPDYVDPHLNTADAVKIRPDFETPVGVVSTQRDAKHGVEFQDLSVREQSNVKTFFNIYFMMTGLHGLHVLIGMGLITWVLIRAVGGVFGPAYFTPVDMVGLYWHLVDLIWIFLFPLLYLIH